MPDRFVSFFRLVEFASRSFEEARRACESASVAINTVGEEKNSLVLVRVRAHSISVAVRGHKIQAIFSCLHVKVTAPRKDEVPWPSGLFSMRKYERGAEGWCDREKFDDFSRDENHNTLKKSEERVGSRD